MGGVSLELRKIPAVERVLVAMGDGAGLPRALRAGAVRRVLAGVRTAVEGGGAVPEFDRIVEWAAAAVEKLRLGLIQPVINGTGVIVHTNLGRAPLARRTADFVAKAAAGYANLEFDLATGERGPRAGFVEAALADWCGAEAATVVNNCAAALILALRHAVANGRSEVVISRGELVEIGGGFRVPEILETSGARLREVGTTNRTTLADYEKAIGSGTAAILSVHRSNFSIDGFTDAPGLGELAVVAHGHGLPLIRDLGSGAMVDTAALNALEHEPTAAEALAAGCDGVCFSGDKLLGGPQAGILVGAEQWIAGLKKEPLFRALRCDKLVLAALQDTLLAYFEGGESADVGVLSLLRTSVGTLRARAEAIAGAAPGWLHATVEETIGRCGGGTMPRSALPSLAVAFRPADGRLETLAAAFRQNRPAIVGYCGEGAFRLDLRTVFPHQDAAVIEAVKGLTDQSRP